jgi:hypothetical protein
MGRRAMRRRQRREGRIHPHMLHTREEWARLCGREEAPLEWVTIPCSISSTTIEGASGPVATFSLDPTTSNSPTWIGLLPTRGEPTRKVRSKAPESSVLNSHDWQSWACGDADDFLDTADEAPTVVVVEFPRAGVRIRTSNPEALADIVCIETGCGDPLMHRRHYIDA